MRHGARLTAKKCSHDGCAKGAQKGEVCGRHGAKPGGTAGHGMPWHQGSAARAAATATGAGPTHYGATPAPVMAPANGYGAMTRGAAHGAPHVTPLAEGYVAALAAYGGAVHGAPYGATPFAPAYGAPYGATPFAPAHGAPYGATPFALTPAVTPHGAILYGVAAPAYGGSPTGYGSAPATPQWATVPTYWAGYNGQQENI